MDNRITVLGLDPGYINYGWSVIRLLEQKSTETVKVSFDDFGLISNTITTLKGLNSSAVVKYTEELDSLVTAHSVKLIAIERYQSRGFKGIGAELVNVMIGILLNRFCLTEPVIELITPSQWKNTARASGIDLKNLYKVFSKDLKPHEIDATMMALYLGLQNFGFQNFILDTSAVKTLIETSKPFRLRQKDRIKSKCLIPS